MTSRSSSFASSKTRSFGMASLFVLLGAAILPVPGCSDEPTPRQPSGGCTAGQTEDTDDKDCKQRVCQNGAFVDQNDDTEVPDDGNSCTDDACVGGQAQNTPNMAVCSVGNAAGTCIDGGCKVTCAVDGDCNDNSSCTTDACDMASLTCSFADDPANYDDNNECTNDSCVGGLETHENADSGTACGTAGMCDGNGVCTGCTVDTDCPADEPCVDHFCDVASSTCQTMPKPDGDLPDDKVGDCQLPSCVGGALMMNAADMDLPEDSNECTIDTCSAGVPANDSQPPETTCSTGFCDGLTSCVQCVTATNCMGDFSCSMNMCFDCNNGMKDGTESDMDCGRDCANKCVDGLACNDGTDCFFGTCAANVCVSCFDGVKNGTESDLDCGAACDQKCAVGKICDTGADCTTGSCSDVTKLCLAPSCTDKVKNGSETDVDCGGACTKCAAGKICKVNSDCMGGLQCVMGVCG